jgi:hypothetical protein
MKIASFLALIKKLAIMPRCGMGGDMDDNGRARGAPTLLYEEIPVQQAVRTKRSRDLCL